MERETRRLKQLISVGPAVLRGFEELGVRSVKELARRNPERMYEELCDARGERIDVCCLDVFRAAVEQARDPQLAPEKCQWWYWSRERIANGGGKRKSRRA